MKKKLLIHICCAPDQTVAVERTKEEFDVTGFFSNSCIEPDGEYRRRLDHAYYLAEIQGIPLIEDDYFPDSFLELSKGHEKDPEKGKRCDKCVEYRLRRTAAKAAELGFDIFASTLTVSPHKKADFINKTGEELAWEFDIEYLPTNFKKQDGFKRSVELSKKLGIHRQNYCGCRFSLRDKKIRDKEKFELEAENAAIEDDKLPSDDGSIQRIDPKFAPPGAFYKPQDQLSRRFKTGKSGGKK